MHEKFIHGTQKFVYLLVYLTGGSSKKVIGSIFFLQKKRNVHYHKVNDNHDKIGDSPYE